MKTKRKTFSDINITPLTDIFLVLLIIMMVTAPMVDYKGLSLSVLTAGTDKQAQEKPKTLMVQINALGEFTVAGQPIERDALESAVQAQAPQNPEGVIIEFDPDSTHEAITRAMAAAENAGVTKIAVLQKDGAKPQQVLPPTAKKHNIKAAPEAK